MKFILSLKSILFVVFVCVFNLLSAQEIRVAILDFDNISGITKYDGLGKAMSSMLISDIESNVSPKRLQLVERAQIQKILKEQNFQKSGAVNKSTVVQAGKILGVKYMLLGDVFILNDQLIINARLINAESGDIIFSKKQEGKVVSWLSLKTNVAKELATSLSQPFTSPTIPDAEMQVATITSYGNAITAKDLGDFQKAENLIETVREFNPEFKYLDDLRNDVEKMKKQMQKMEEEIGEIKTVVTNKFAGIDTILTQIQAKIKLGTSVRNPTTLEDFLVNAMVSYNAGNFKQAEIMFENIFNTGYIKYDLAKFYYEALTNNYNLDYNRIHNLLKSKQFTKNTLFFTLAEIESNKDGVKYYKELEKINIKDPVLRSYMQNLKAKSFYINVQNYRDQMGELMCYWTLKFSENKEVLGLKLVNAKDLFFNYVSSYKKYVGSTSYSSDDNAVFDFYASSGTGDCDKEAAKAAWTNLKL